MGKNCIPIRADPEFMKLIKNIKAEYLKKNKTPPSISKITKMISTKIKKKDLVLDDVIIKM